MRSTITAYTPLISICSMALDEMDKSVADLDKLWILGHRAYTDITSDFAGQPITVRIPKLPNQTVPFPANCRSWSKIGILDDKGQINTLRINSALTTFRDDNPNRLQDLTPNINNSIGSQALVPYYSNFYYGGAVYQLFGVGNGVITYGDCTVDEVNRLVVLGTEFKYDSIMFEYIPSPETDSNFLVPTILQEAIIAFIKWKLKTGSYQEWIGECTKARRRMPNKKVVLQTINQVIRESQAMKLRS